MYNDRLGGHLVYIYIFLAGCQTSRTRLWEPPSSCPTLRTGNSTKNPSLVTENSKNAQPYIISSFWAIYYKSLTWFKAILEGFPYWTTIWGDLGWGRYKLPRSFLKFQKESSLSVILLEGRTIKLPGNIFWKKSPSKKCSTCQVNHEKNPALTFHWILVGW